MPAWSPEVAEEFIRLARDEGRAFDQGQLQKLVYIAHGWRLAFTGEPLTGDRPEAWSHGPVYRRLADALAGYGLEPVSLVCPEQSGAPFPSDLDPKDRDFIAHIYKNCRDFDSSSLAALTRRGEAPWARVFDGGAGRNKDISHQLIQEQFIQLARQLGCGCSGDRLRLGAAADACNARSASAT